MRSGQGNPDEARSARYVLKDYVNAKLLFCHPPPGVSETEFNEQTHQNALRRVQGKKKAPVTRVGKDADTFVAPNVGPTIDGSSTVNSGGRTQVLDAEFFQQNASLAGHAFVNGKAFSRSKQFPHQNSVTNDGTPVGSRQARIASVLANQDGGGNKHHKKMKRVKQRSGKGYD